MFLKPVDGAEALTEDKSPNASQETSRRWITKSLFLFNAAQVEGYEAPVAPATSAPLRLQRADRFFANIGADIRHGGNRAYFRPARDHIQMPPFEAFPNPLDYYSTLGHETTHWTAVESRLGRDLSGRFGSDSYAVEELVAEIGAAFISADLELSPQLRPDHAAYIQSWLKV